MAEPQKTPFPWPKNSWTILTKIIRAWYTVAESSGETTQKKIASIAGVQQSQVSTNKAFLQAIGIIDSEGGSLTDQGRRVGIGLSNDNPSTTQQGLQQIVKDNGLLRDLLDIIRGRGSLKTDDFYDEVALHIGGKSEGFVTGTAILLQILTLSGAVEIADNTIRPSKSGIPEQTHDNENGSPPAVSKPTNTGLTRIPIAVSTNAVWYIEVGTNPKPEEVQKFLEMQKLMFS